MSTAGWPSASSRTGAPPAKQGSAIAAIRGAESAPAAATAGAGEPAADGEAEPAGARAVAQVWNGPLASGVGAAEGPQPTRAASSAPATVSRANRCITRPAPGRPPWR